MTDQSSTQSPPRFFAAMLAETDAAIVAIIGAEFAREQQGIDPTRPMGARASAYPS